MIFTSLLLGTLAAAGGAPKVGCSIALQEGAKAHGYTSNAFFKTRPVTEEMARDGIDLNWCDGAAFRQFDALWLMTEQEGALRYPAAEASAALAGYVRAGGGLVVTYAAGRYAESPVDACWKEVFSVFDMEMLHEEVSDFTQLAEEKQHDIFFTDNFADHPVTKGVPGLWLPNRSSARVGIGRTWGSVAVKYGPDWQVVAATGPGGRSYFKDPLTNLMDYSRVGFYRQGPVPLVAARTFGKGRIVFIAIHKDNVGWAYGIDKWPNITERSERHGRKSDAMRLLSNAIKWAAEPSMGKVKVGGGGEQWNCNLRTSKLPNLQTSKPPYRRNEQFGRRWEEEMRWEPYKPLPFVNGATGLVGLHSSHSDGESTVAEYVVEAKKLGLSFLIFTEPLAASTPEKFERLRADCAANSTADFYCCPGVEYTDASGVEWIVFAEKIAWPQGRFRIDGRDYETFDGKTMLQRGKYGLQCLYRGAPLNLKHVTAIGADTVNLAYLNAVVPRAYDVDRVLYDNDPECRQIPCNVQKAMTVSYTRVRRAADLARAVRASVTVSDGLDGVRRWANAEGDATISRANEAHTWVRMGADVTIRTFDFRRVPGTDVQRFVVGVSAPTGLREVRVEDGVTRTLARFDPQGKSDFDIEFTCDFDRQSYPQLVVEDVCGNRAVSGCRWMWYYHAGVNRSGDNSNFLPQNPHFIFQANWDDAMAPVVKYLVPKPKHWSISEARFWYDYYTTPSRLPASVVWNERSRIPLRGVEYPSERLDRMPSSVSRFPLVMPNVVTVIDQRQGDFTVNATRSATSATYGNCSIQHKVGENPYWRRHHRVYQLTDRIDSWWLAVHKQNAPDYRGGYTVTEGEIEFVADAVIERPVELLRIDSTDPTRPIRTYRRISPAEGAANAVGCEGCETVRGPGDYYAPVADTNAWYGVFGLTGSDPLSVAETAIPCGIRSSVCVGTRGQAFRKGDKLRYRFALGSFVDPPAEGAFCDWFSGMMDGSRFVHEAVTGEVVRVDGFLELAAADHQAAVTLGPASFIQNYPVRVRGLVDNGSAFWTDGDKIVKPVAFLDGLAYASVPLEERKTWTFMNRFLTDDPALRFSYVPSMPGHEKATVQIMNPTGCAVTATVRNLVTGETFQATVPAGGMVAR